MNQAEATLRKRRLFKRRHGGFVQAEFQALFYDAGAGRVDTTLAAGLGVGTFTRATTAWTKLPSGLWASVATGIARSSYIGMNTAVGAYGGYFAEGAGTQLVTPTASIRDMTNAAWIKVTMTTAKTSTGIDGVANSATRLTATGANSTILQTLVAAASSRTYSAWIKRITGTGAVGICQDGVTFTDITSQINSSTFTLVQLNASQLNAVFGIRLVTSGDAIDVDFNQFEAGAFATSPMDAAGAARNADVLTYPSAGNAVTAQGTIYAECSTQNIATLQGIADINDGSNSNDTGMYVNTNGTFRYQVNSGTVTQADIVSVALFAVGTVSKCGGYWNTNAFNQAFNGVSGALDSSGVVPVSFTTINIGTRAAAAIPLYGTIKNVRIWQTQLSDSLLQSMTA